MPFENRTEASAYHSYTYTLMWIHVYEYLMNVKNFLYLKFTNNLVNVEHLLRRIKDEFPEIRWRKYRCIERGWDHYVIILDNNIVFRTPKRFNHLHDKLRDEMRLLKYLKSKLDIGIPDYNYVLKDGSAAGYRLLSGQELKPSRFKNLSSSEKR